MPCHYLSESFMTLGDSDILLNNSFRLATGTSLSLVVADTLELEGINLSYGVSRSVFPSDCSTLMLIVVGTLSD